MSHQHSNNPMVLFRLAALLVCCLPVALSVSGVPARPGFRTYAQPDGTLLELRHVGDEFFSCFLDREGNAYGRDAEGRFHPASDTLATRKRMGAEKRVRRRLPLHTPGNGRGDENFSQVQHLGEVHVPVILVQFSDYSFRDRDPRQTFTNFFTANTSSARKYFLDQSNSMFDPHFDLYGPVTLKDRRVMYGGNLPDGGDRGLGRMVAEACLDQDHHLDFSKYDYNGDGECDVVIILYAGDGEASSSAYNAANAIWPCQWDLETSDYGKPLFLDETKVNMFAVFNELNGDNLSRIDGVGTFCHEFSHCLGLPDFYDTTYGPHFGMGPWSVMDHGSYNNDGYLPLGYSAYEKEYMGWISIPEAEPATDYTLTPMVHTTTDSGTTALRLTNPADPDEFYILEPRHKRLWDRYMPAEGLLITHFTYDPQAWETNCVNDFDLQRATVIPADNSLLLNRYFYYGMPMYQINDEDTLTDLWPQPDADALTDYSVPTAQVNTGGFMSKPILDIRLNDNNTVSFRTGAFLSSTEEIPVAATDAAADARWYTLQGLPLSGHPEAPGIYIRTSAAGSRKISIR